MKGGDYIMNAAKITFSNGNVLTVSEDDFLIPVIQYNTSGKPFMGKAEAVELYCHIKDSMIPSILDVVAQCDYFYYRENNNIIYNSKAIVSIENI